MRIAQEALAEPVPLAAALPDGQVLQEMRRRLGVHSNGQSGRVRGDHDLNPGLTPPAQLRSAGVMVLVIDRGDTPTILLTQRTDHLAAHAGQISFPGGRLESTDRDALDAALRETEEEIGVPREQIDIIGRLDTYIVRTGFRVEPFVGVLQPPFALIPDPHEVAEIFEVPLGYVLSPANCQQHTRDFQGIPRSFYVFPYEHRYIWGATAGMLRNLREIMGSSF